MDALGGGGGPVDDTRVTFRHFILAPLLLAVLIGAGFLAHKSGPGAAAAQVRSVMSLLTRGVLFFARPDEEGLLDEQVEAGAVDVVVVVEVSSPSPSIKDSDKDSLPLHSAQADPRIITPTTTPSPRLPAPTLTSATVSAPPIVVPAPMAMASSAESSVHQHHSSDDEADYHHRRHHKRRRGGRARALSRPSTNEDGAVPKVIALEDQSRGDVPAADIAEAFMAPSVELLEFTVFEPVVLPQALPMPEPLLMAAQVSKLVAPGSMSPFSFGLDVALSATHQLGEARQPEVFSLFLRRPGSLTL